MIGAGLEGAPLGLALGLLGALFIGTSDVVARVTAQRVALPALMLFVFGLSTPIVGVWLHATAGLPPFDLWLWTLCGLSGVLNVAALSFLYLALARGPVALASPAAGSFSVMLVALNIFAGEPYGAIQLLAIALVFVGVAMLSRGRRDRSGAALEDPAHLRGTLALALAAAASVTLRFFLAQEATDALGSFETLFLTRAASLICILAVMAGLALRRPVAGAPPALPSWPPSALLPLVLLQAALETLALAAFLSGGELGDRVAVIIGFSAFAAISPLVAWIWLGDPLSRARILWISVVVLGAALAALPSG